MLFPALVLGFGLAAPIMRTARSSLLEVQSQDFVRTAHGKGVAPGASAPGTCCARRSSPS